MNATILNSMFSVVVARISIKFQDRHLNVTEVFAISLFSIKHDSYILFGFLLFSFHWNFNQYFDCALGAFGYIDNATHPNAKPVHESFQMVVTN